MRASAASDRTFISSGHTDSAPRGPFSAAFVNSRMYSSGLASPYKSYIRCSHNVTYLAKHCPTSARAQHSSDEMVGMWSAGITVAVASYKCDARMYMD